MFAAVLQTSGESGESGVKSTANVVVALRSCIPAAAGSGVAGDVAGCVEAALVAAGDQVAEVHTIVEAAAAADPWFADACHLGSHEAGHALASSVGAVEALALVTNMCSSGLIHGVFDAVGSGSPGEETWRSLARTCVELRSRGPAACPDGMGHAAWDATGDVVAAEQICAVFDDFAARSECAEGVVMQRFEPATERLNRGRDQRPFDPNDYCRTGSDPAILQGCLHGVGWLLANDLAARADAVGALRGSVDPVAIPSLVSTFLAGVRTCEELGAGERACTHRLLTGVPVALFRDAATRNALCTADPAVQRRCEEIASTYVGRTTS
jgi:hypothetical protein